MTATLEALRGSMPDAAKDIKLNLSAVLASGGVLSDAERWGVAIASAIASRNAALRDAIVAEARANKIDEAVIEDAKAAAVVMAMNNVFYRFRHVIEKPSYGQKPARLRMNRLAQPAGARVAFELFALAVSAINACETCVRAHEHAVIEGGLSEDHVHDAIRVAAVVHAAAVALEIG